MQPTIGVIGQGYVGKNYADDFETRGYTVIRYALEEPYRANKDRIATCDIVFIGVPTPTTPSGFDLSHVESVLPLVGEGKIAVVKSTLLPGSTEELQARFTDRVILHSPEFLRETSAAYDAAHPLRNLIGLPVDDAAHQHAAERVLAVLPNAPYTRTMSAREAELVKYAGNVFLALKVVYANMLHDLTVAEGGVYERVEEAVGADPRIGPSHLTVLSASGHTDRIGRGAGGHCFIKDLEAFRQAYHARVGDEEGDAFFTALAKKNARLLRASQKDLDLLAQVYGDAL